MFKTKYSDSIYLHYNEIHRPVLLSYRYPGMYFSFRCHCVQQEDQPNDEKQHQCKNGSSLRMSQLGNESKTEHPNDDSYFFCDIKKTEK